MHPFPIILFVIAIVLLLATSLIKLKPREPLEILVSRQTAEPANQEVVETLRELKTADRDMSDWELRDYAQRVTQSARLKSIGNATAAVEEGVSTSKVNLAMQLAMQVLVTIVIMGGAVYIILSHTYEAKDKNWAYGAAGTVLGFWLRH